MKANTSTPVGATCGRPPRRQQHFLKIPQLFSKNAELFAKKCVYIGEGLLTNAKGVTQGQFSVMRSVTENRPSVTPCEFSKTY